MEKENQRQYELTFILSPELDEKEINSFEQEVEKNIKGLEGSLKKKEKAEKRILSYPIKKFQSGYYLVVNFLFNPEKLRELLLVFKHKKEILRFIINFIEEPSVVKIREVKKKKEKPKEIEKIKKKEEPSPEKKVKLEEIDKKLDEILGI